MVNSHSTSTQIEELLQDHYRSPAPDPAFISQLRSDLLAGKSELTPTQPRLSKKWAPRSWHYAVAGTLLLILGAVLVLGPGQVWAQLESWVAYFPGWGKVELSGTRVLEEPVSLSGKGVTFEVQEFVVSPDKTYITIHITGIPESAYPSIESGMSGISDTVYIQWDGPDGQRKRLSAWLSMEYGSFPPCLSGDCSNRHPDGLILKARGGPLPADITQVRVEWLPYRIIPNTDTSETWTLNLSLSNISTENAQDYFKPGYSLLSAEDSLNGVKITVEEVYSDTSGIIVDALVLAPEPAKVSVGPWVEREVFLFTDTGYRSGARFSLNDLDMIGGPVIRVTPEPPRATMFRLWPARWKFDPIDGQPSQMTLEIGSVLLEYDTRNWFEIDIGQDPEVGTIIPLDLNFDIEGFPLIIYQARIVMAPAVVDEVVQDVKAIEFLADDTLTSDGKRLNMISFCSYDQMIIASGAGGSYGCRNDALPLVPATIILENGTVRVAIDTVEIEQLGPWVISWDVP